MKRIILPILLMISATNNAHTPIVYINGQPHNAGLGYGITALQDLMDHKFDEFAPSFQTISSTIFSRQEDDLEYTAMISALTYNQKLDGLINGLFFQAIAPITIVFNKIDTRIATPGNVSDLTIFVQNASVADISLLFGYKFFDTPTYQAVINIDAILPVQQEKKAHQQLIPTMGNGGHVELGASINSTIRAAGDDKHNLMLTGEIQYHHLFQTENQHLLGLTRTTKAIINQALVGHAIQLIPIYNATVANVTVSSGNTLDAAGSLTYNYHKFFINLGCSYHFRTETTLTSDNTMFYPTFNKFQLNGKTVKLENIDSAKRTATVPESHLLTINANIGLACKEWLMPVFEIPYAFNISLGGNVTAGHANNPASWDINVKSGISF